LHRHPIRIAVVDGSVVLEGEVSDLAAKKLAVKLAHAVPGVERIVDRLLIASSEAKGDGAIRDALCELLLGEGELRNCTVRARRRGILDTLRNVIDDNSSGHIAVGVENGVVTLDGALISLSHKRLATVLAWWTPGCRAVVNSIEVVPPEDDNDDEVLDALELVLEADPLIQSDEIKANCRDYVVTIGGYVRSDEERRRAELDAWAIDGVDRVVNTIEVRT